MMGRYIAPGTLEVWHAKATREAGAVGNAVSTELWHRRRRDGPKEPYGTPQRRSVPVEFNMRRWKSLGLARPPFDPRTQQKALAKLESAGLVEVEPAYRGRCARVTILIPVDLI